jgi:hypothetical protein
MLNFLNQQFLRKYAPNSLRRLMFIEDDSLLEYSSLVEVDRRFRYAYCLHHNPDDEGNTYL